MLNTSGNGSSIDDAIARVELQDPELRRMRLAVDVAGRQLKSAPSNERVQANRLYRNAMRQLLHYLVTTPSNTSY